MGKSEIVAMILAGGQGSRLGVLTKKLAKPAVPFGGKYRIIDFPLSNCSNSFYICDHQIKLIHTLDYNYQ